MQTSGRHRPRACLWIDWWSKRHKEKLGVHSPPEVLQVKFSIAHVMDYYVINRGFERDSCCGFLSLALARRYFSHQNSSTAQAARRIAVFDEDSGFELGVHLNIEYSEPSTDLVDTLYHKSTHTKRKNKNKGTGKPLRRSWQSSGQTGPQSEEIW